MLGVPDVYAAGDITAFPIKQGGLACQQADAAAEHIAARAGATLDPAPFTPVLRGMLLTERWSRFLRREVEADDAAVAGRALWWPPAKIAGRELAGYLQSLDDDFGQVHGLPVGHASSRRAPGRNPEPAVLTAQRGGGGGGGGPLPDSVKAPPQLPKSSSSEAGSPRSSSCSRCGQLAGDHLRMTLVAAAAGLRAAAGCWWQGSSAAARPATPADEIADDLGVRLVQAAVTSVDTERRRVILRSGDTLPYDSLVMAHGTRTIPAYDGVIELGGTVQTQEIRSLRDDIGAGQVRSVAFVAPTRTGWLLPLYEAALDDRE